MLPAAEIRGAGAQAKQGQEKFITQPEANAVEEATRKVSRERAGAGCSVDDTEQESDDPVSRLAKLLALDGLIQPLAVQQRLSQMPGRFVSRLARLIQPTEGSACKRGNIAAGGIGCIREQLGSQTRL